MSAQQREPDISQPLAMPLFVAFTIRKNLIRVTSGRDMTDKELRKYSR